MYTEGNLQGAGTYENNVTLEMGVEETLKTVWLLKSLLKMQFNSKISNWSLSPQHSIAKPAEVQKIHSSLRTFSAPSPRDEMEQL